MARIILKLLANLLVTWTIAVGFSALFNGQHLQPVVLKNVICDNCEFVLTRSRAVHSPDSSSSEGNW